MGTPRFYRQCWDLLREVPCGKVTTYKEIAHKLGSKGYRVVGRAMHENPYAPSVPCHRVVRSNGEVGGYRYGKKEKIKLLRDEGIIIKGERILNLERYIYRF